MGRRRKINNKGKWAGGGKKTRGEKKRKKRGERIKKIKLILFFS